MDVENAGQGGPAQDRDWPVITEVESGRRQQGIGGEPQGDREITRAIEGRGHTTTTCTAAPAGAAVHVGGTGLQDVQKTGMSQDGVIRTVTTDMRNMRLEERILQDLVVKATGEAGKPGITGEELAQAIPGVLVTSTDHYTCKEGA